MVDWLLSNFDLEVLVLRDLGLWDVRDIEIFDVVWVVNFVIMIKDSDFVDFVCWLGILF